MPEDADRITIESITSAHVQRVDRAKYMAMREALLDVLPVEAPGLTVAAAKTELLKALSAEHFPGGAKAGWWFKAVQLDLEKKGIIRRADRPPVRLYRVK